MELKAINETLAIPSRAPADSGSAREQLASESAQKATDVPRAAASTFEASNVTQADLEEAVAQLNETARIFNKELDFQMDEGTGRMKVSVIDSQTGDLIAELPPQKLLDVAARIQEQIGVLLDEFA